MMTQSRMTPEQMAERQNEDREIRLELFPPQEGVCFHCTKILHPFQNDNYDGTTNGYCNKMCRKRRWRKLVDGGMMMEEAEEKCWIEQ